MACGRGHTHILKIAAEEADTEPEESKDTTSAYLDKVHKLFLTHSALLLIR